MKCIDLAARYGDRFQIAYDECQSKTGSKDPWLARIECKHGHVSPFGDETLAASVNAGRLQIANRLKRSPCVSVHQDGDNGELTVLYDVADFDAVAKIMKPRKKRRLSDERLASLISTGAQHRFQPSSTGLVAEKRGEKLV